MSKPEKNLWIQLESYIRGLQVDRICDIEEAEKTVSKFSHQRHRNNLIDYLKRSAAEDDRRNSKAVYLIRDADDCPVAYFSLRCGVLYRPKVKFPGLVFEQIEICKEKVSTLVQESVRYPDEEKFLDLTEQMFDFLKENYIYDADMFVRFDEYLNDPEKFNDHLSNAVSKYIKDISGGPDHKLSELRVCDLILELAGHAKHPIQTAVFKTVLEPWWDLLVRCLEPDRTDEPDAAGIETPLDRLQKRILRQRKTWIREHDFPEDYFNQQVHFQLSGLEIAHFCTNDEYVRPECLRTVQNETGWKLGKLLFWFLITDHVIDISKSIGMNYAYLFAADSSKTKKLVTHYRENYRFEKAGSCCLAAVQEEYDQSCQLMVQKLSDLQKNRESLISQLRSDLDYYAADASVPSV